MYLFSSIEDAAQIPFPELCGESVEYLEKTSDALLTLSNFRLFIRFKDSFVNVSSQFCPDNFNLCSRVLYVTIILCSLPRSEYQISGLSTLQFVYFFSEMNYS